MRIDFAGPTLPARDALVVAAFEGRTLAPAAQRIDTETGGALGRAMAASRFSGKARQTLEIVAPAGVGASRILLLGLGSPGKLDSRAAEDAGGTAVGALAMGGAENAALALDLPTELAARAAFGARLACYRFDKYLTGLKPEDRPSLAAVTVVAEDPAAAEAAFGPFDRIADGVFLARDLVSEPANVIYPESLAAAAADRLRPLGVEITILGPDEMRRLGMGALLGVAQGSAREPRLLAMEWKGAEGPPLALVGKGVTFDTGGISLKPAAGMEDMKWDMGGAAAVIGAMAAIAGRKARAHVVGVAGLVENMPSGTAQRPGDVVKTMSGQTVEVINTDAEGRLVLADALAWVQATHKPSAIVDLATLTGAIIVSLGHVHAGLFANDDALAERLAEAGKRTAETLWRMPLGDDYDKEIKSEIADMKNVGPREGGSITAAQFLQRFVKDTPWAHLDIAGKAWGKKALPTVPKGGTGFGVRLLDQLVADAYETR